MKSILIVGIGNTLRRDDGVGHAVVKVFESHQSCQIILTQQLLPELIDEFVRFRSVVFVDATIEVGEVKLIEVEVMTKSNSLGHVVDARWLLGLSHQIYGNAPKAFLLSIPIEDLGFGEGFSEIAMLKIDSAICKLRDWLLTVQDKY